MDWNKRINLISRKGEDSIIEKHFLDSVLFLPEMGNLCTGVLSAKGRPASGGQYARTILDIGSGGGFPAIPLAIMKPEWKFTLCESIKKKVDFLIHLVKELNLENVQIVNDRVRACRGMPQQGNKYDIVTARAVAKLDELIKYALPLLQKDGHLIAYKAKDIDDEIENAKKIIDKNNLKLEIFSKEVNGVKRKLVLTSNKIN